MTYGFYGAFGHNLTLSQQWQQLKIGGGGFSVGLDSASDGTIVCRADVFGAYVSTTASPTWRQLQTGTAFGSNTQVPSGPYEVAICKSDSTRIYILAADGYLYRSSDTGQTFTQLTVNGSQLPTTGLDGNRNAGSGLAFAVRMNGRWMACDPYDKNVLYVCTPVSGTFRTLDGGSTWQTLSSIPSASNDGNGNSYGTAVCIDGNAAAVNGRSPNVYIIAYGSQMYKCSNAGSTTCTFTATTGGPTTVTHMAIDKDGTTVYVADNSQYGNGPGGVCSGTLWAYNVSGNTWTNRNLGSSYIHAIAPDPATAGRVVLSNDAGGILVSTTYGSSPTALTTGTKDFTDIPWLGLTPNTFYCSDIVVHPTNGKLVIGMGLGNAISTAAVPNSGTINWTDYTVGIEDLITNWVSSSPSYTYPMTGHWDRPMFSITDPSSYPSTQRPNNSRAITHCWAGDYAKSSPGFCCYIINSDGAGDDSGYTTDRTTYNNWPTKPNKVRLVTSAPSSLGSGTLTFASVPSLIAPSSLGGNRQATYLGIAATTTAPSLAGSRVLHFGGGLPAAIGSNIPCNVSTDENQIINGLLFDSAIAVNYLGTTGDVQLDGGPNVDIPTGTTVFFRVSGNPINGNVTVSATSSTTVTMTGEPSGHALLSGETIEFTSGKGGCIAASTPSNVIWVGSNDEPYPWYTLDGGATWNNAVLETSTNGFGSSGQALPNANGDGTGWGHAYYINCICVAADPVIANRFIIYNGRLLTTDGAGLWDTLDGGATWSKRVTGRIGNNANQYQARVVGVPGNAYHFFMSGAASNIGQNNPLMWSPSNSTDRNSTWYQIANISNVAAIGVGKANPSYNYPTVYVVGQKSGVAGIWRGEGNLSDWQAGSNTGTTVTWTNINGTRGMNAYDWLDSISFIEGDVNVYGRVYVARGHSGVAMGYLG